MRIVRSSSTLCVRQVSSTESWSLSNLGMASQSVRASHAPESVPSALACRCIRWGCNRSAERPHWRCEGLSPGTAGFRWTDL